MSAIKWDFILTNIDEFKEYFENSDLIEVSKLSKLARLKLRRYIFENIIISSNVDEAIIYEILESKACAGNSIINLSNLAFDEYIVWFNRSIHKILPYIKHLNIINFGNHHHLLEITNFISHLSSLKIHSATLSLTAFQAVLDRLQNLESLSATLSHFIQFRREGNDFVSVRLPNNIQSLVWISCKASLWDLDEDPKSINYTYNKLILRQGLCQFQLNSYPSLISYSSQIDSDIFDRQILELNPQLSRLNYTISSLEDNVITLFNLFQNIKSLELNIFYVYRDISDVNLNFPKLTYLSISGLDVRNSQFLKKMVLSSPSLIDLKIDWNDNSGLSVIEATLISLVNRKLNFKKLSIKARDQANLNFEYFKPDIILNHLEICYNINVPITLLKLSHCDNLKTISIMQKYINKDHYSDLSEQNSPKPWKYLKLGDCIKYYKLAHIFI
jgi:ribosome biogenesis protein Tsr3